MNKYVKSLLVSALVAVLSIGAAIPVHAEDVASEQRIAAAYLCEKGIMVGNESGDMMLDCGLTRAQLAAVLTRITANPEHIEADKACYRSQCLFSDVPEWAQT